MKNKIEELLNENTIVVLDTNVYLRIYDSSPEYIKHFIDCLSNVKEKIGIPYIVNNEYKNQCKTRFNHQKKKFERFVSSLTQVTEKYQRQLDSQMNYIESLEFPDLEDLKEKIQDKTKEIDDEYKQYINDHDILEKINDEILDEDIISNFYEEMINNNQKFKDVDLFDFYKYADEYDQKSNVPGTKDKKKNNVRKYNDYVIWKEIIRYCKENDCNCIFVTNDLKSDWFDMIDDKKIFKTSLEEKFSAETTKEIIGLEAREFIKILSKIYEIEIPDAVKYLLELTSDEFINSIDKERLFDDAMENKRYTLEDYVDDERSTMIGTEQFEISDDIDFEYIDYEIVEHSKNNLVYLLRYNVNTTATSHHYYGRDDDTKEVILSEPIHHKIEGKVIIPIIREGDYNYSTFEESEYVVGEVDEIELVVTETIEPHEMCVQCHNKRADYFNDLEEGYCADCMVIDNEGEICPRCGQKYPQEYFNGGFCTICIEEEE